MDGADFSYANFSGAKRLYDFFASSELHTKEVNFPNANFTNTDLSVVDFSGIKLINLTGAIFDGANLKEADFSGLNLSNTSFIAVFMFFRLQRFRFKGRRKTEVGRSFVVYLSENRYKSFF